jgi:hypothetical protein
MGFSGTCWTGLGPEAQLQKASAASVKTKIRLFVIILMIKKCIYTMQPGHESNN